MNVVVDETYCGALCQHPSCWQSQRRLVRGVPNRAAHSSSPDSEDEGLPTQKVVNLLEDYGEDPRDRYPAKHKGKALHERSRSVSSLNSKGRRASYPKPRVPHATPATPMRSTSLPLSANTVPPTILAPKARPVGQVEVREVFDLDDLQSDWHETFMAKKYYVWVPNPNRQSKEPNECQNPQVKQMEDGRNVIEVKDMTEDMIPQDIEWQRMNTTKHQREGRRSPISFYSLSPYTSVKASRMGYHGLEDLIDLPRDVLSQLMQHINESELMDREKFADALLRALPKLEKENTTVSLAYGNVLRQKKMPLLDGKLHKGRHLEPIPTKQVFLMDDSELLERLGQANDPLGTYRSLVTDTTTYPSARQQPPQPDKREPPSAPATTLNKRTPLPDIAPGKIVEDIIYEEEEGVTSGGDDKKKVPYISLGLPTIPSGVKHTRTFTYKRQEEFDFALGPVSPPVPEPPPAPTEKRSESVQSTTASSVLHITMPTVTTDTEGNKSPSYPAKESGKMESETVKSEVSRNLPKTLHTEHERSAATLYSASPDKTMYRGISQDSMGAYFMPQPPTNTPSNYPTPGEMHPEDTEVLDPITESARSGEQSDVPRSRTSRSVRFASDLQDVPAQPPSSPCASEDRSDSAPMSPSQTMGASMTVHYSETSQQDYDGLMVIGRGHQKHDIMSHISGSPSNFVVMNGATPSVTPEPWPQVDEEAYKLISPTPPLQHKSASALHDPDLQSMAVHYDRRAESAVTSMMGKSAVSRDSSSLQSVRIKKMFHDGQADTESPGPPPPSPEPTTEPNHPQGVKSQSQLNPLEEVLESDSEMTISAKPPSNLDDTSTIQTPSSMAPSRGLVSREAIGNMHPVLEPAQSKNSSIQEEASGLKGHVVVPTADTEAGEMDMDRVAQPEITVGSPAPAMVPATQENDRVTEEKLLDQFDSTKEQYEAELKQEYEKLSNDGDST